MGTTPAPMPGAYPSDSPGADSPMSEAMPPQSGTQAAKSGDLMGKLPGMLQQALKQSQMSSHLPGVSPSPITAPIPNAHGLVGSLINSIVMKHKESETRKAMAHWQTLDTAMQRAQMVAMGQLQQKGIDPQSPEGQQQMQQLVQQGMMQDPILNEVLDPKVVKQMYKALNVDILNPKETVYGTAYTRNLKANAAKYGVQQAQQMHDAFKKQMIERVQQGSTPGQVPFKDQVEAFKAEAGLAEAQARIAETKDNHARLLQEHNDSMDMRRLQLEEMMKSRETSEQDKMFLAQKHNELMGQIAKSNAQTRMAIAQMNNETRREAMQMKEASKSYLYNGKLTSGANVPEDARGSDAVPIKDPKAFMDAAHNMDAIITAFNEVSDPKYNKLWDDTNTNTALTEIMQEFGQGGAGAGAGPMGIHAPSGVSDLAAKMAVRFNVPNDLKPQFSAYVAKLRKMQEMALPMQMALQGGKIGRGSAAMFGAMLNALPGPGTLDGNMAQAQWSQFRKTMDAITPDFGDYLKNKPRDIAEPSEEAPKPQPKAPKKASKPAEGEYVPGP